MFRAMWLVIVFLVAVHSVPVHARDSQQYYRVKGVGADPCDRYLSFLVDRREDQISRYRAWMTGFITGVNMYLDETNDIMGQIGRCTWMD